MQNLLFANDSDIDKTFGSMHQRVMMKTVVEHSIKIFEC